MPVVFAMCFINDLPVDGDDSLLDSVPRDAVIPVAIGHVEWAVVAGLGEGVVQLHGELEVTVARLRSAGRFTLSITRGAIRVRTR